MIPSVSFGATFYVTNIPPDELKKIKDFETEYSKNRQPFVFNKEVAGDRLSPYVEGDKLVILTDHPIDKPASNFFMVLQMLQYFGEKANVSSEVLGGIRDNFKRYFMSVKEAEIQEVEATPTGN